MMDDGGPKSLLSGLKEVGAVASGLVTGLSAPIGLVLLIEREPGATAWALGGLCLGMLFVAAGWFAFAKQRSPITRELVPRYRQGRRLVALGGSAAVVAFAGFFGARALSDAGSAVAVFENHPVVGATDSDGPEAADHLGRGEGAGRPEVVLTGLVSARDFGAFADMTELRNDLRPDTTGWGPTTPARRIDWHNASRYCEWLGVQEGYSNGVGRLPTEAEWRQASTESDPIPGTREWTGTNLAATIAVTCYASERGDSTPCRSRRTKNNSSDGQLLFRCALTGQEAGGS